MLVGVPAANWRFGNTSCSNTSRIRLSLRISVLLLMLAGVRLLFRKNSGSMTYHDSWARR